MEKNQRESTKSLISSISTDIPKKVDVILKRDIRWTIMIIYLLISIIISMDTGLFTSASTLIKETLKIDDKKFGLFGSCIHFGRIFGTIIFMFIFNIFNRKNLLIISFFINCISIFCFTITDNIIILFISRIINGFCTSFGIIYFPIWIDQFGIQNKKTLMMSLLQMAFPIGMILGYTTNTILGSKKWKITLLIETISLFIFNLFIIFIPKKYYSKKLCFKQHFDGVEKIKQMKKIKIRKKSNQDSKLTNNYKKKYSNDINESNNKNNIEINRNSLFSQNNLDNKKNDDIFSFKKKIKFIITNKIYICTILYKSINQFILSGLTFWLTDYLENILEEKNSFQRLYIYIEAIVIGPIIGIAIGGFLGSMTGGYEKKNSVLAIFILQAISSFFSIFVPLVNNINLFSLYLTLFNLFMSSVIPVNTGLILWTLPKNLKGFGNGVGNLITTIIGKFPSPLLYGYIQYIFNDYNKRIGMHFLMKISFLGEICLAFATLFRFKDNFTEIEKVIEETEIDRKKKFNENLRKSINSDVISSAFNNDISTVNDNKSFNSEECDYDNEEELNSIYSYKTESSKDL
jgi:MFS family permease